MSLSGGKSRVSPGTSIAENDESAAPGDPSLARGRVVGQTRHELEADDDDSDGDGGGSGVVGGGGREKG